MGDPEYKDLWQEYVHKSESTMRSEYPALSSESIESIIDIMNKRDDMAYDAGHDAGYEEGEADTLSLVQDSPSMLRIFCSIILVAVVGPWLFMAVAYNAANAARWYKSSLASKESAVMHGCASLDVVPGGIGRPHRRYDQSAMPRFKGHYI